MRFRTILIFVAAALLAVFFAAVLTFQSAWFKNKIRDRLVAEIEKTTGGRVEIGALDYSWRNFTVDVTGVVVHGRELRGAPPLFRAAKIQFGLKLVSMFEQTIDLQSLAVDRPEIHVEMNPDGTSNLPTPKPVAASGGKIVADILNLRIRRVALTNGVLEYNSQKIPLNVKAGNLTAGFRYQPSPARYTGEIQSKQIHVTSTNVPDIAFDLDAKLAVEKDQVRVESATVALDRSTAQFAGTVESFSSPRAAFTVNSRMFLPDAPRFVQLPIENRGEVDFNGKVNLVLAPFAYAIDGRLDGRDLSYVGGNLTLRGFSIKSDVAASPGTIQARNIDLAAFQGHFRGNGEVDDFKRFHADGMAQGFSIHQLAALQGRPASELNGTLTGPVHVEGAIVNNRIADVKEQATLQIVHGGTGIPIEGSVEVSYDQRTGMVQLGNSNLTLGTTQIVASGNLGQTLEVHVTSRNLKDFFLALPLIGEQPPENFSLKLSAGGSGRFDGTASGPVQDPHLSGQLQLTSFEIDGLAFNRLVAGVDATRTNLNVHSLALDADSMHVTGSGQLALAGWWPQNDSAMHATLQLRGGDVQRLLLEHGHNPPITGTLTANGTLSGTYDSPQGNAHIQMDRVTAYDEPFTRVTADVNFSDEMLDVKSGRATAGKAEAEFSGVYHHPRDEWNSGQLQFKTAGRGFSLSQIRNVVKRREGVEGRLDFQASGTAHQIKGDVDLDDLDSQMTVRNAVVDGRPLGDVTATGKTRGQVLDLQADATLRGTKVHGQGEWRLTADYPGGGQIQVPRMMLSTLRDLLPSTARKELPFGGFLSATIDVSGPLKKPDALRASVTIPELQINASSDVHPRAGAQEQDLILRSAAPLAFDVTSKGADIKSARFSGTDTTLEATGRVGFGKDGLWNMRVQGTINLAILQIVNPDLLASGSSLLNATIRGSLNQPDLSGRLEVRNASLFIADLPNGVEKANGVILFDRNRANIERLSGESGGGSIVFQAGSFVGFSGPTLIYRVQATANHVRYRSPEGLSVTADGNLSLAGTSQSSMLSGTVTVIRAAFTPHTDVGSLLASTAKPISVPATPNEYVRGLQFDVRIDTGPNLEVITTFARDIQADANLRLRGNAERPVLLGSISVTEGEIDFFGNKYTINRGEVNFVNPVKIEPVVNMDLGTRVRGITVDITFSGPLEKLNFSYRSDPPLESSQIIALLAVGREPVGIGALANAQATTNTSYLAMGTNDVLQQAITAPVSGRLQRFFGVSHIKIDPQLTDITSVPQALLSIEQQISKDITLTYITNLSRTSEQVVRVEWNVSRRWSVVAVRDENGLFGVDFQFRKGFR